MGFSTIIAAAIIAISLIAFAIILIPPIEGYFTAFSDSAGAQHEIEIARQETSLEITSITLEGNCNDYNITIALKNKGSRAVHGDELSVFDSYVYLGNSSGILPPTKTINMKYESLFTVMTDHVVKVVSANGAAAYGVYDC